MSASIVLAGELWATARRPTPQRNNPHSLLCKGLSLGLRPNGLRLRRGLLYVSERAFLTPKLRSSSSLIARIVGEVIQ